MAITQLTAAQTAAEQREHINTNFNNHEAAIVLAAYGWLSFPASMAYSAADSPTFTALIDGDYSAYIKQGTRIKLTQSTVKYFIVSIDSTYSSGTGKTTVTLYGGTDYTLTSAAISGVYYSYAKAPAGFPMDPAKWSVSVTDITDHSQATASANTWYNLGSMQISAPIGCFKLSYTALLYLEKSTTGSGYITLSTANNSESDKSMTSVMYVGSSVGFAFINSKNKTISLSAKTTYYLNAMHNVGGGTLMFQNTIIPMVLKAECALL